MSAANSSGDVMPSEKRRESEHPVISNDDLLIEILLRLPVLSLLLFKSVSKRWLSLIKTSKFTQKLDPPSGLFLKIYSRRNKFANYDFFPLDIRIPSASAFTFGHKAPPGNVEIWQSCNGLLLCYSSTDKKLYVYNPSISCMFKMIPEPFLDATFDPMYLAYGMRMMFDPAISSHYKIIHVQQIKGAGFKMFIYSSETGNWSVCEDQFPDTSFIWFQDGVYWNGAIHWVNYFSRLNLHNKLDLLNKRPVLTTSETHLNVDAPYKHRSECKLFVSRGCLLLISIGLVSKKLLYVYEMRDGCSEWSVKYVVNLDNIMGLLPKFMFSRVCGIVLGEREDDSFIVVRLSETIVQYKFVSKTLHTLVNLGSERHLKGCCFDYIASFANV